MKSLLHPDNWHLRAASIDYMVHKNIDAIVIKLCQWSTLLTNIIVVCGFIVKIHSTYFPDM